MLSEAQFTDEFNQLRSQNFWNGFDNNQLKLILGTIIAAGLTNSSGGDGRSADITTGVDQSAIVENIRLNIDELTNNRGLRNEVINALDSGTNPRLDNVVAAIQQIDNGDLENIKNFLNSINNNQITQTGVTNAINNAVDIDTLIARLISIDNKTAIPTIRGKTLLTGFLSVAALNNNLLDPTGAGAWTDVRQYQSAYITYVAGGGGFTPSVLTSAVDAAGGGQNGLGLQAYDYVTGGAVAVGTISGSGVVSAKYDLSGVNFIRIGAVSAIAGNRILAVFNTEPTTTRTLAQITGTVQVVTIATATTTALAPQSNTEQGGVIAASTTSPAFVTPVGQSYQTTIVVGSITGTLAQSIVRIQESPDSGATWRTVYTFDPITLANGGGRSYKSPVLTATGNRIRYIETVTGTTPSINRTFIKSTINALGLVNQDTRSTTVYNANLAAIDIPAYGVIKAISVTPTVATPLWLQIHDTVNPVIAGVQPRQSIKIPVDGLVLGSGYFGDNGRQLGSAINSRITISTSANNYTPIALAANTVQLYVEAI